MSTETNNCNSHDKLNSQIQSKFLEGQFLYVNDPHSREMLINAWNAITLLELWNYMKNDQYSYMWNDDKEIGIIYKKMEELGYTIHSGGTFGWTMRQMQYIAKFGEKKFAQYILSY